MNFKTILEPLLKNAVKITPDITNFELPIGSSKIGGKPDLPPNFEWFYYRGESYSGIIENRPLSFIAQINCEEVSELDKDNLLPKKGMLYFFYELTTMTWGFNPRDKGSAKVYYFDGDMKMLSKIDFPENLPTKYQLPETTISFSFELNLPDFEELIERHGEIKYEKLDEYYEARLKLINETERYPKHKLLGYADIIQNGMLLECELTTNGIYTGGVTSNISEEDMLYYKSNSSAWQLLLQVDSIETDNYELLWGDCGKIYYYININDLLSLRFDNCWLVLQCY
jgi:uncharacterized protein YwqG